jgi:DNA-binding response OmpR family regulator
MSRVTLLGLPDDLSNQLARVLLDESYQVSRRLYVSDIQRGPASCAIFISGDNPDYPQTISLLRESYPGLPVIVVTRQPESRHWLDALEAGATDYCGAPFEHVQLRWLLGSVLAHRHQPQLPARPAA